MLRRVCTELVMSHGTTNAHPLQGLSLPLLSLLLFQAERINYISGGDWVAGQPKPLFATLASALLAGI